MTDGMSKEVANALGRVNVTQGDLLARIQYMEETWKTLDYKVLDSATHREELAVVVVDQLAEFTHELKLQRSQELSRMQDYTINMPRRVKLAERAQRQRTIAEWRRMAALKRKKSTKTCTCGEHYGIDFYDGKEVVHGGVCPQGWWIIQARLANHDKKLGAFVKETPMETTNKYLLKGKKKK